MENEIFKMVVGYGIFAVLFCYLLFYVLKENSKREGSYQGIIKENQKIIGDNQKVITENQTIIKDLTQKINVIEDVKEDVREIKTIIQIGGNRNDI